MPEVRVLKLTEQTLHAERWSETIRAFTPARTLKREAHSAVFLGQLRGRDVVVKIVDLIGPIDRLASHVGLARLQRQWRGHERLATIGVATGQPICLARLEEPGTAPRLLLALQYVPGKSLLQHVADNDLTVKAEHRLAAALGRQIASIAMHRRYNRDHKLSNLIAVDPESAEPTIAVIDAAGVRHKRKRSRNNVAARMLFSAIVEPTGLNLRVRRSLQIRVALACAKKMLGEERSVKPTREARDLARHLLARARARLQLHGDPTPRINPLAKMA